MEKIIRRTCYIVIFFAVSIPAFLGYIMVGGEVQDWIIRIEEMQNGIIYGQQAPLESNLWLLAPAVLNHMGISIGLAYCIFMLLIQLGTILAASMMFKRVLKTPVSVMFATLFYMTCPYRLYICFDKVDLGIGIAWMLIPLVVGGITGIYEKGFNWPDTILSMAALAGLGYADNRMFVIVLGLCVISCVWYRKIIGLLPICMGMVLYTPGSVNFISYLFLGGNPEWNIALRSIAGSGYRFGRFLNIFAYTEGNPGFGIGLLGALFITFWLWFVDKGFKIKKEYNFFIYMAILFLCMSLIQFPWDMVQRVALPFLRMVSLLETPAIFFGLACMVLCVPTACAMERVMQQKEAFVKFGYPIMIFMSAIAGGVYFCNMLTYYRMPLF